MAWEVGQIHTIVSQVLRFLMDLLGELSNVFTLYFRGTGSQMVAFV
jgi:hypothetical protein